MLFENSPDEWQKVSLRLMQNGAISLFWNKEVLKKYIKALQEEDFDIVEFDCEKWLIALVFQRYDVYNSKFPRVAEAILDIIHRNTWYWLLFGKGFIALVQSDDPEIKFENIGKMPAGWNPDEWLNKNRGL